MNSPVTRERYSTRLRYFLTKISLTGDDDNNKPIEELCKIFVEKGKQDPNWIVNNIVAFLVEYKDRYDRREISGSTIRNYIKIVKLLCEMNDIAIPWKKITRGLPKGRQWADDRAPSIEEIRKLCEYPDRRIKPLVYTMCSSGIRLGAWDYLCWQDVFPIIKDGGVIAARLTIYYRQSLYIAYLAISGLSALGLAFLYRKIVGNARIKKVIVLAVYATLMTGAYLAMPPNPDAINAPMDLVTGFRIASGFTMSIFWGLLGIILGAFWDKTKSHEKTKVAMV